MKPLTANPILHEYALLESLHISPEILEDQIVEMPSFKKVLSWIFGKPLKVLFRKGLEAKKVDLLLSVLDQKRIVESSKIQQEEDDLRKIESGVK